MVDLGPDIAFRGLSISPEPVFYPRQGFEDKKWSEKWDFYVVTRGRVPGIYTHWEDAQPQVDRFPSSSHKKYPGWSAATSAWDASRRPRSLLAPSASPVKVVRSENGDGHRSNKGMSIAPAPAPSTRVKAERSSVSAPSTPTRRRKKTLYVYSGATETTIYADQQQASSAARQGLADGSFRKVGVTTGIHDAFDAATESALEVTSPRAGRVAVACLCALNSLLMKRTSPATGEPIKRRRNVYSLSSFGHSLKESPQVARAGNLTADGRRADVRIFPLDSEAGPSSTAGSSVLDDDTNWLDMANDLGCKRGSDSDGAASEAGMDDALRYWVTNFRDQYLRVLVAREGRMGQVGTCSCGEPAQKYRCAECHGAQMLCRACIVEGHRQRPLCRIEAWNGQFFKRKELRQLGLRVQLGHPDNRPCPRAHPGHHKFVVIAPNGFHPPLTTGSSCSRLDGTPRRRIILEAPLTIPALKLFHAVSHQGKTTVYHFFNALAKITDNTGTRTFRLLMPLTSVATSPYSAWCVNGATCVLSSEAAWVMIPTVALPKRTRENSPFECIACPKPGVNLPEGWEQAPPEQRKKNSSWKADPSIQDGWAYFVRSLEYIEFVKTLGEQKEMSTCTGLAALDHANTKYSQGYAATGCGMVTCGRHEVVAKNGVADLQAGEKYGNMDYVVASAWRHLRTLLFFLLSYDIMCQWYKNLKERLLKLPHALRIQLARYIVKFVIPKLHILGHLKLCQELFSLLYTLGAAQADMEGIERIWSSSGLMGASTREMGPGSRQDTLDDFWHYWNWNKVVGMGHTLRTRLLKAVKELVRQKDGLDEFSRHQEEEEVAAWRKQVSNCPLIVKQSLTSFLFILGPTLKEIELELLREEQAKEHESGTVSGASDETMTEFLMLGLEVEGQQRQLAADMLANKSPTTKELTEFVTRRTRLLRQVRKLRLLQRKFSPGALQRLAVAASARDSTEAECTPLLLPSGLAPAERLPPLCVPGLAAAEARLRDGQCSQSLDQIRHGLSVKKRLQTYKTLHSRRQHQNTRARGLVDTQQRKVDIAAGTYRQARLARIALVDIAGACGWKQLDKDDLRMPEDEEEAKRRKQRAMKGKRKEAAQVNESGEVRGVPGMGEKNRLISWIWLGAGHGGGVVGEGMHAAIRVEWCKAYARVKRWQEEVLLLQEEMRRCLRTLEWQAAVWDGRAAATHYSGKRAFSPTHMEGAMALAARQAALRRRLANRFRKLWQGVASGIERPEPVDSSASSEEEGDVIFGGGGNGSDAGSDTEDEGLDERSEQGEVAQGEDAAQGGNAEQQEEEQEEEEEEEEDLSPEEAALRRARMDELLAIQSASITQYDEV
ncbi:hypothetical protein B0H14DRAFT_2646846 [Mycena olivaceomarginata]|nr:hypothetical protein B0H14DRAFT_2646846 [Mycena olivaceomarginata]